jgi:hypothetical protein
MSSYVVLAANFEWIETAYNEITINTEYIAFASTKYTRMTALR